MTQGKTARFLRYHLPVLLWGGMVAAALLVPLQSPPGMAWPIWLAPLRPWADKLVHALLFFVMAFLSYRSLRVSSRIRWPLPLTAAAVVAYSALLELLQTLTVARQPELGDLAANALGVLLFTLAVMLVGRRRG